MKTLFTFLRISILLSVFITIAFYAKTQKLKSRAWTEPLQVIVYPIDGDNSAEVKQYIEQLDDTLFDEINLFFQVEAENYNLDIEHPVQVYLGKSILNQPPRSPAPTAHFIHIMWWVIKFRYWAFQHTPDNQSNLHRVRIFLHFHKMEDQKVLQHSLGLDKGLLAIVHAFASKDQEQQNNIIIAHELLHTVGATDKYNHNRQPIFPNGYAEPEKQPLYPQDLAEIMSAKIPFSPSHSKMAKDLSYCIIGEKTALEINWLTLETTP